jgi:tetratricopeptide (TPR) repeat protein
VSAPDLHPEELLDKAAAGTLAESERAFFDAHLAQCAVCRFELQARRDFSNFESPGLNVDNLVAQALSGAPVAAPSPSRATARKLARFAVAALVLFVSMASFAAVARATGVWVRIVTALSNPSPVPEAPRPTQREQPREREVIPDEVPEPKEEAAPQSPRPAPPSPAKDVPALFDRAQDRLRQAQGERQAQPSQPPPPAADVPDAGALFARANQARVQGDRPEAVKLYGELLEQFPHTDEAGVVQATLGRLLLDSGDPQRALAQLDAYLQSDDFTLREEVLANRATALSRLNRPRDEVAAWNALLESYPDSIHAARARSRLAELDPR